MGLFDKKKQNKETIVSYDMTIDEITDEKEKQDIIRKAKDKCFRMGPNEYYRYKIFADKHKNCRINEDGSHKFGAIGGGLSVSFMGTGLGNIITCKCHACGETADITDSDCW